MSLMDSLVARDTSTPCILFRMWFWVAIRIAHNLLHSREEFEVSPLYLHLRVSTYTLIWRSKHG